MPVPAFGSATPSTISMSSNLVTSLVEAQTNVLICVDILDFFLEHSTQTKQLLNINVTNPVSGETLWHVLARYNGDLLKQLVLKAESLGFKVDLEAT